jgi:rare lipoprotein A
MPSFRIVSAAIACAVLLTACGGSQEAADGSRDVRIPNARGTASYYADKFEGRQTASGEVYDHDKMTAAHRSLPFGTKVRVIRVDTGASVVVRINDRGPFKPGRIIDLSKTAARKLGIVQAGLAEVRIELAGAPAASSSSSSGDQTSTSW